MPEKSPVPTPAGGRFESGGASLCGGLSIVEPRQAVGRPQLQRLRPLPPGDVQGLAKIGPRSFLELGRLTGLQVCLTTQAVQLGGPESLAGLADKCQGLVEQTLALRELLLFGVHFSQQAEIIRLIGDAACAAPIAQPALQTVQAGFDLSAGGQGPAAEHRAAGSPEVQPMFDAD